MSVALEVLARSLDPADRGHLQSLTTTRALSQDELLIQEGALSEGLWLVEEGELVVVLDGVEVSRVGPGGWVGEVALFDPGPASATVRATRDSRLLGLSAEALEELVQSRPQAARVVVRALAVSLAQRLRSASEQLFAGDEGPGDDPLVSPSARGWLGRLVQAVRGEKA